MRQVVHRWKAWRRSYRGYWRLSSERLSPFVHSTLARLRYCESTNNYRAQNGSGHSGAYQYAASTWTRAQSWAGVPLRYRTDHVLAASRDHQDAVTGRFFFAHRGEWACSA